MPNDPERNEAMTTPAKTPRPEAWIDWANPNTDREIPMCPERTAEAVAECIEYLESL